MKTAVGLFRTLLIATMISGGIATLPSNALADASQKIPPAESQNELKGYIVVFDEPGLMYYDGSIAGLRATSLEATGQRKVDVSSAASIAYLDHLAQGHDARIAELTSTLGRSLGDVYRYDIAFSGIGVRVTGAEASALSSLPGVKDVQEARDYELDTNRGPQFIGAGSIWNGDATPDGVPSRGEGTVIGVIDSGSNQAHPSFGALPAECGASAGETKLTALTCLVGGVCGPGVVGATCASNNPGTPEDCNGHGSHTASTAGGNTLVTTGPAPAPLRNISGVATCAKIVAYKVCEGSTCNGLAITAAINRSIADGVDVVNYSISGGGGADVSVWGASSSDRLFLDALNAGIIVAASAGNTRADNPTPVGDVSHRGPWLTSVAASSHDQVASAPGSLQITGPGTVPGNLAAPIALTSSSSPVQIAPNTDLDIRHFAGAPNGCAADPAYPANFFDGGTALVSRGVCPFAEKVTQAVAAGASSVLIYNNAAGIINMAGLESATVPVYSILQTDGNALVSFSGTLGGAAVEGTAQPPLLQGDVLAGFSLRGPISPPAPGAQGTNNSFDVTKPDVTGPGVEIYAAVQTPTNYGILSGTSMSSPHVAGAYALIRAVRPDWSASEVKSAVMMTAANEGTREDATTPWNADDVGTGRVDLTKAALAGLVLDETFANFLAADPGTGGQPRDLNLASLRHSDCTPSCTWTRTLSSTLDASAAWTVSVDQPQAFDVEVSPSSFTIAPGATQVLTFTATPSPGEPGTELRFGRINLSTDPAQSPDLAITVTVQGESDVVIADEIYIDGFECADGLPGCDAGGGDIVVIDDINFVPNPDFTGGAIQWLDGTTCDCDTAPFNFNVYGTASLVQFFWPLNANESEGGVSLDGTNYSVLASGATIDSTSQFVVGTAAALTSAWTTPGNVDGFLGFRFDNAGTVNYGYARITTGAGGRPVTIVSLAYNSAGDPITIP